MYDCRAKTHHNTACSCLQSNKQLNEMNLIFSTSCSKLHVNKFINAFALRYVAIIIVALMFASEVTHTYLSK